MLQLHKHRMDLDVIVFESPSNSIFVFHLARSSRKQRLVNLLLCCLGGSCRHRSTRTPYSPPSDPDKDHEVKTILLFFFFLFKTSSSSSIIRLPFFSISSVLN